MTYLTQNGLSFTLFDSSSIKQEILLQLTMSCSSGFGWSCFMQKTQMCSLENKQHYLLVHLEVVEGFIFLTLGSSRAH